MDRIYIDSDEVKFIKTDYCQVDLEFYDGRKFSGLEPRRLFPVSGLRKYITLLDGEGKEIAVIRNLDSLIQESRVIIEECLEEYYFIPKINAIVDITDKHGNFKWTVETDKGLRTFKIRNRHSDVKLLYDGRVLFVDSDDNRYEITSVDKLDSRSKKLLSNEL